jgi:L-asparagine transporter-like permease
MNPLAFGQRSVAREAPGGHAPPMTDDKPLEQFGYRQELKRSLGLGALVVYGLVFINPTSPFSIFGFVYNLSHGMVPLVYVFGLIAMTFTAASYVMMARAFPVAGSVYSYAGHGIGSMAGFLAGWALLLDYILMPTLIYVLCAVAIEALVPGFPRTVVIVAAVLFNTGINLLGIEASARLNAIMLTVLLAFLGLYFMLGVYALSQGSGRRASIYRTAAAAGGIQHLGDLWRAVSRHAEFSRLRRHYHPGRRGARRRARRRPRHHDLAVPGRGAVHWRDLPGFVVRARPCQVPAGPAH